MTYSGLARRVISHLPRPLWVAIQYAANPRYRAHVRDERHVRAVTLDRVLCGPFQGLSFEGNRRASALIPKLAGAFEKELESVIREIINDTYACIVDIGAAEGYYGVGFARCMPRAKVICFETLEAERRNLGRMVEANAVRNVEVRGHCSTSALAAALPAEGKPLIKCDIEGGEVDVLDPGQVPSLKHADLLVEVHDHLRPGAGDTLRGRFSATHEIRVIQSRPRAAVDLPEGLNIDANRAELLLSEGRTGEMSWFWMKSKNGCTPTC